jgi:cation transport regulator ChaC
MDMDAAKPAQVKNEKLTAELVAAPDGKAYAGKLPLEQIAHVLARAAGHWGSCA